MNSVYFVLKVEINIADFYTVNIRKHLGNINACKFNAEIITVKVKGF